MEACGTEPGLRRFGAKRHRVEADLQEFVDRFKLPADSVARMSDEIYKLYRKQVTRKRLDQSERRFDSDFRRQAKRLAERTSVSPEQDARTYAAHMTRLDTLEKRKVGRRKALDAASQTTWEELSATERRAAKKRMRDNVLPGTKVRQPASEIGYLREVVALLEREIGRSLPFSSWPPAIERPSHASGRHYGPAFDVMMASAEMADYPLTNEAMARLIRRLRRPAENPQKLS